MGRPTRAPTWNALPRPVDSHGRDLMSRTGFAILIGSILFPLLQVSGVAAAPPPSGTIACDNHSSVTVGTIVPPLPAQTPSTRLSKERVDGIVNGCDLSGVSGGKTTILEGFLS